MKKLSDMALSDYDKRQLALMKDSLELFSTSKLSFKKLIDNLEGLLGCLESVDTTWKNEFHEHWFTLEQVYAVAAFRNEPIMCDDPDIVEAIEKLSVLVVS